MISVWLKHWKKAKKRELYRGIKKTFENLETWCLRYMLVSHLDGLFGWSHLKPLKPLTLSRVKPRMDLRFRRQNKRDSKYFPFGKAGWHACTLCHQTRHRRFKRCFRRRTPPKETGPRAPTKLPNTCLRAPTKIRPPSACAEFSQRYSLLIPPMHVASFWVPCSKRNHVMTYVADLRC